MVLLVKCYFENELTGILKKSRKKKRKRSSKYTQQQFCWIIEILYLFQTYKHWWFSGRMLACHAGGPGSIPGQCIFVFHKLNSPYLLRMRDYPSSKKIKMVFLRGMRWTAYLLPLRRIKLKKQVFSTESKEWHQNLKRTEITSYMKEAASSSTPRSLR